MNIQESESRNTLTFHAVLVRTLKYMFPGSLVRQAEEEQEGNRILRRLRELQSQGNNSDKP